MDSVVFFCPVNVQAAAAILHQSWLSNVIESHYNTSHACGLRHYILLNNLIPVGRVQSAHPTCMWVA